MQKPTVGITLSASFWSRVCKNASTDLNPPPYVVASIRSVCSLGARAGTPIFDPPPLLENVFYAASADVIARGKGTDLFAGITGCFWPVVASRDRPLWVDSGLRRTVEVLSRSNPLLTFYLQLDIRDVGLRCQSIMIESIKRRYIRDLQGPLSIYEN